MPENSKAIYVLFEDGYDVDVWRNANGDQTDQLGRFIVHSRWIDECIRKNSLLKHVEQLHLCPVPVKTPC